MPRLSAAVLLVSALVLAACGGGSGDDAEVGSDGAVVPTTVASGASAPSPGSGSGAPVLDELAFTAPDVRGGQVEGADFAGQDLVIWFWAPW